MLAERVAAEVIGRDTPRVLDLCTGSGVVGVAAARAGAEVTVVDVSRRALASAWLNAKRDGQRLRVRRGDLLAAVRGESYDCISINPPYVPSPTDELPRSGAARAWEGGRDGRSVLDRFCRQVRDHLRPDGAALVTHSSLIGVDRTLDLLRESGLVGVEVVAGERGPLGPLMSEARSNGLVPSSVEDEEVVVIRGMAPGPAVIRGWSDKR